MAIYNVISRALDIYVLIVLIRCIMSWLLPGTYNRFVQIIYELTEPPLAFIRRYVPSLGMFDLSAIILVFAVQILNSVLYYVFLFIFRGK